MLIEAGRIASIEPSGGEPPEGGRVIDATGLLAIPGLINAHTHSPENPLRGGATCLRLEPWLAQMLGGGGPFDAEDHYACALAGAVEMLLGGTTAVIDHLWMTAFEQDAIDAAMRAYRDIGIRAAVAPLIDDCDSTVALATRLGVSVPPGETLLGLPAVWPPVSELSALLRSAIGEWHGQEGGRLQVFAGPGGVQWCSDELLASFGEIARAEGTGIQLHLLETEFQDRACRDRFGESAVAALDRLGVLGSNCSLAHSVWVDEADVELIAERGATVVHNPGANQRLGSGRAPVPSLLAADVTVALGTDGSASSDNQDMWDAVKLAAPDPQRRHRVGRPGRGCDDGDFRRGAGPGARGRARGDRAGGPR